MKKKKAQNHCNKINKSKEKKLPTPHKSGEGSNLYHIQGYLHYILS